MSPRRCDVWRRGFDALMKWFHRFIDKEGKEKKIHVVWTEDKTTNQDEKNHGINTHS